MPNIYPRSKIRRERMLRIRIARTKELMAQGMRMVDAAEQAKREQAEGTLPLKEQR